VKNRELGAGCKKIVDPGFLPEHGMENEKRIRIISAIRREKSPRLARMTRISRMELGLSVSPSTPSVV